MRERSGERSVGSVERKHGEWRQAVKSARVRKEDGPGSNPIASH